MTQPTQRSKLARFGQGCFFIAFICAITTTMSLLVVALTYAVRGESSEIIEMGQTLLEFAKRPSTYLAIAGFIAVFGAATAPFVKSLAEHRRSEGLCEHCGYALDDLPETRTTPCCPECGQPRPHQST